MRCGACFSNRVYHSRIRDVDHLKQRLIEERRCFDQNIIDRAFRQWRVRLRAYVRANGGHFEHKLKLIFCVRTAKVTFPYWKLLFLSSIFKTAVAQKLCGGYC